MAGSIASFSTCLRRSRATTFDYVALPVKRLFVEFANGVGDLKYPDNPNWALQIKKDAEIVYSEPVVEYVNGVMVRPADHGAGIDRIRKLGLVAGWTPLGFQEQIESGTIELVENNSYDGLLKQAILGRIDGAYSNVATSRYYLNNTLDEPDGLVFDEGLPHVRNARRLSSIHHPDIIAEFDRFLQESADEIAALKQHYAVEDGVLVNQSGLSSACDLLPLAARRASIDRSSALNLSRSASVRLLRSISRWPFISVDRTATSGTVVSSSRT